MLRQVEQKRTLLWWGRLARLVEEFESSGAQRHRNPHNNALRHSIDCVLLPIVSSVEEMIGCSFKL